MAKETFSSLIDLFKTSSPSTVSTLLCDVCGNKLSVFRRKKPCAECKRQFCSQCLQRCRDRVLRCKNCSILTMRPPLRSALLDLRVKDLQYYLNQNNVSTKGCLEKEDLVNVLLRYASSQGNPPTQSSGNTPAGNSSARPQSSNSMTAASSSCTYMRTQPEAATASTDIHPTRSAHPGHGDSDSSSDTSFEMVQRPSSDENIASVHSSASSASVCNGGNTTPSALSCIASTPGSSATRSDDVIEMPDTLVESPDLSSERLLVSSEPNDNRMMTRRAGAAIETTLSPRLEAGASFVDRAESALELIENSVQLDAEREESFTNTTDSLFTSTQVPEGNSQLFLSQPNSACNSPNLLRGTMASISSEAEFEALTVKQLKDILHRHRVNYHGCCEKAELIDQAKRLYRDYCSSRADLEKLDLDALCKICMDAPVECVMLECGHMATCTDCGRQLSECPICRQFVVRIVRTFKA